MRARPGGQAAEARPPAGTRALAAVITGYQRYVSPAFGPHCRFEPSCSAYALQAVRAHGALWGSWLALRRLARCHPFHPGGLDPVPPARRRVRPPRLKGASS